ncbi:MAG: DUF4384 domain-containing protein [Desulfobacula sp.]|jgi:hypothetical protein|nr:DUF4384 domain-containing protein [Deltaproteobacteria bacterium]MBT6340326.1 DUF4384 domain-containing protein [Desulfobacula sp.]
MFRKLLVILGLISFLLLTGCVAATEKAVKAPSDIKTMSLHTATQLLAEKLNVSLKGKQLGRFAVADLIGPGSGITGLGEQIADDLSVQLFQSNNFSEYVERKQFKQLLSTIISEKDVPYFDQSTVSTYGKSMGLQDMLIGTIRDLRSYYYVKAKIVNIETTKILAMGDVNISKTATAITLVEKKQTSTLTVSVSPAIQGTVMADGRHHPLKNGAAVIKGVPYGNCSIVIQPSSGYQAIRKNILIKSPMETFAFSLKEKKYDISFTIVPPDATLVIDGKKIILNEHGFAKIDNITAGNHSLLINSDKKGYKGISQIFNPAINEIFQFNLLTTDPIYNFNDTLFQKVQQMKDKQDFNVKLWTNKKVFKPGDTISFFFNSEKDCYLNIVDIGTSGNITLLFPNKYHQNSRIDAGKTYKIPDESSDMFAFRVDPPAGIDRVYAIASTRPLNIFDTNFRDVEYKTITRGQTRDITTVAAGHAMSNVKLTAASTCIINVIE